jgi:hypothetical protein
MDALRSHTFKQRWFARHANDFLQGRAHGKRYRYPSSLLREIYSGKTEIKKQDSIFVGLQRDRHSKPNYHGRISLPWTRVTEKKVYDEITLLNDFLIVYAEGYTRNVYATDSPDMAEHLTQDVIKELERLWPHKSSQAQRIIEKLRDVPVGKNKWGWWEN